MPKIAIISDIHANLPALEAVLSKLSSYDPQTWICLGDIVGYGPEPSECIDLIKELKMECVLGNHDAGVAGIISENHFRNPNRRLIELTKSLINSEQMKWLSQLPMILQTEEWVAVHASPNEPEKWKYLESAFTVRELLANQSQKFCFVGHTHKPVVVSDQLGKRIITESGKYLINPGSVGQSRDDDYRASCGLLNTDTNEYLNFRLDYDIDQVISLLIKRGFSFAEANHLMRTK